jgi:hypothetical protein
MILFAAMRSNQEVPDWLWLVGVIPLLIGITFILIWYIERRNTTSHSGIWWIAGVSFS